MKKCVSCCTKVRMLKQCYWFIKAKDVRWQKQRSILTNSRMMTVIGKIPTKTAVGISNIKMGGLNILPTKMTQGHILPHPGSPEWTAILMEATQTGNRKSSHTESGNKKKLLQRIFNNKVSGVFICLELVCILLLAILYIYPSYFGLHTREGYWGLFLHIILLLSLVWIICIFYRDMRKKEQRWYYRLFSFVIATGTTFVVVILVHDLTLDLIEHDVRSYKGTFSLEVHRHNKRPTDYTITWKGDTLSSDRQHNISFAHFKELEQYRTVRVTYWRHTGLVWSIEPLEKK